LKPKQIFLAIESWFPSAASFIRRAKSFVERKWLRRFLRKGSGSFHTYEDQATLNAALSHRSFDSMAGILGWLLTLGKLEFREFTLEGCRALEIGTGKFFTHALALNICGCAEVISVDKYRQLSPAAVKLAMSKPVLARRFLSMHVSHDDFMVRLNNLRKTGYDLDKLHDLGVKYQAPVDLIEIPEYRGHFDFVFSYTVFEHVPVSQVRVLLEESVRFLKPGGMCIHFIDLEDHRDSENKPFDFLSSGIEWEEEMSFDRGNRLRLSAWKGLFNECENMDWRFPYIAVRHDVNLPSSIDKSIEFTDDDDLRAAAFTVVGRRLR